MRGGSGYRALGLETRVHRHGQERVTGRLYHLGDYPGLVTGPHGLVHGELVSFEDPGLIEELDAYELYDPENPTGSEYRRIEVDLLMSGRRGLAYEYNRTVTNKPIIATGNWRTR
ncbi:gamma-glutamylcyclotransferase [Sphingobium sp. H33]|uniref:Gamma-glutamylcyclotransferase n=2 Tax=Sphingobium nicotianae TaxID=2782607 RepID=A0A9X1AJE8_9SPHN|nr:gamma-glutamylcyclotransferase [Sphingobium nicotianae]